MRDNPITQITADGVRTEDGSLHEADVIIFATGFDAVTGALTAMEPTPDAVEHWGRRVREIVKATVLPHGPNSWFLGANIPGKPQVVQYYFGGAGAYRQECEEAAQSGYEGFVFAQQRERAEA